MKFTATLGLLLMLATTAATIHGQDKSEDSGLRTVSGLVLDKGGSPVHDAVVYLKNVRTLTVRTYISDSDGKYRFSGLDPNVDYEIHAEQSERTSKNHVVSTFDSRKELNVTLRIDRPKKNPK